MYLFKMRMHVERRSPYFRQMMEFYEGREREHKKEDKMCNIFHREKNKNKNVVSFFAEYQ